MYSMWSIILLLLSFNLLSISKLTDARIETGTETVFICLNLLKINFYIIKSCISNLINDILKILIKNVIYILIIDTLMYLMTKTIL